MSEYHGGEGKEGGFETRPYCLSTISVKTGIQFLILYTGSRPRIGYGACLRRDGTIAYTRFTSPVALFFQ